MPTMNRRDFVHTTALGALAMTPLSALHGGRQADDWRAIRVNGARVNQHLKDLSQ